MKTLIEKLRIANRTALAAFMAVLSVNAVAAEPRAPQAIARVLSITVDGKVKPEATNDEAIVKRASRSMTAEAVRDGMEFFTNDEVVTFGKTSIRLIFPGASPDKDNEIILGQNSVITISSASCGLVCRFLAKLKDAFDGRNRTVGISNESTEYEFATFEDGTSSLIVYEGMVNLTRLPNSRNTGIGAMGNHTSPLVLASHFASDVQVGPLNQVNIGATGEVVQAPKKMTEDETRSALEWSSTEIVAMHPGDPVKGSEGVSKYSPFKSEAERNLTFIDSRFQSVWKQDPGSLIKLGDVYNDWSEGRKATDLYAKAEELFRKDNPAWQPSANLLLSKAEASRLIGDYGAAAGLANSAMQKDPKLGEVGNLVLGNIKYSHAISVRNGGDPDAARQLLAEAAKAYSASADLRQPNESLAIINLLVTFQALGNINAEKDDKRSVLRAGKRYETAAAFFEDAQQKNPDIPLAKTARADIFLVRGTLTQRRTGGSGVNESFTVAENLYQDVIEQDPRFAPAYKGLGNLYAIRGEREQAQNYYEQWAALRPKGSNAVVAVPSLIGKSKLAALQVLTSAGLIPSTTGEGDWISSQDLHSGTRVPVGTKVSVKLSTARLVTAGRAN